MKKHIQNAITVIFMVFLSGSINAQLHIVEQQNFSFSPQSLNVNVGDTVRWLWTSGSHTTTSVNIPSGAGSWDSPLSQSDTSFDYVVTHVGVHDYHCTPHSGMGMIGSFEAFPTTGVKRSASKNDVKIFPNPARDFVNLEISHRYERCEVVLSDIIGNKIKSQLCNRQTQLMIVLDDLSDGIYLLHLYGDNDVVGEQKLVVVN